MTIQKHPKGVEHGRWAGSVPSYTTAHQRVSTLWGKASLYPCITDCGRPAREWAYDGTDPEQLYGKRVGGMSYYSAWPEFYMPMCLSCHKRRDKAEYRRELEEYREWKHRTGLTLKDIVCPINRSDPKVAIAYSMNVLATAS